MILCKKLSLATAIGAVLTASVGVQAAEVSYNSTSNIEGSGRTASGSGQDPFVAGLSYANAGQPNFNGGLPATWYTVLGATDSATLSSADIAPGSVNFGTNGGTPGILSVGGASYQNVVSGSLNTSITPTNWGHNADFGLLQLSSAANVTITVSADASLGSQLSPGFSVWQGWDANASGNRHGTWLNNGAPLLSPGSANPGANESQGMTATGLNTFEGTVWTAVSGGSATLTLNGLAAGDYSIIIGGYQSYAAGYATPANGTHVPAADLVGGLGGLNAPYTISFTTSPVPLPGAVWLFGGAMAAWLGLGKRKQA